MFRAMTELPDTALSGNGQIFLPDSPVDFRTVRFISGHLATLAASDVFRAATLPLPPAGTVNVNVKSELDECL